MVIFLQNIQSLCSLGDITVATSIFFTVYVLSGETKLKFLAPRNLADQFW